MWRGLLRFDLVGRRLNGGRLTLPEQLFIDKSRNIEDEVIVFFTPQIEHRGGLGAEITDSCELLLEDPMPGS